MGKKKVITSGKKATLSDMFGKWKTNKTAQQVKDESRHGWM